MLKTSATEIERLVSCNQMELFANRAEKWLEPLASHENSKRLISALVQFEGEGDRPSKSLLFEYFLHDNLDKVSPGSDGKARGVKNMSLHSKTFWSALSAC